MVEQSLMGVSRGAFPNCGKRLQHRGIAYAICESRTGVRVV